jgi:hypothetical protein
MWGSKRGGGDLVAVVHNKYPLKGSDAQEGQATVALLSLSVKKGGHGIHHRLQGVVEYLTHVDEALGGAPHAGLYLPELPQYGLNHLQANLQGNRLYLNLNDLNH